MNDQHDKSNRTTRAPIGSNAPHRNDEPKDVLDWDLMTDEQRQDILDHLSDMPFQ
ncbi:hypothetical protein [Vibrio profundi]|uniref:hypothetical protein n=1 Tax=Vibrio profundi TaxID=1774960 RepID=UPI0037362ADA